MIQKMDKKLCAERIQWLVSCNIKKWFYRKFGAK